MADPSETPSSPRGVDEKCGLLCVSLKAQHDRVMRMFRLGVDLITLAKDGHSGEKTHPGSEATEAILVLAELSQLLEEPSPVNWEQIDEAFSRSRTRAGISSGAVSHSIGVVAKSAHAAAEIWSHKLFEVTWRSRWSGRSPSICTDVSEAIARWSEVKPALLQLTCRCSSEVTEWLQAEYRFACGTAASDERGGLAETRAQTPLDVCDALKAALRDFHRNHHGLNHGESSAELDESQRRLQELVVDAEAFAQADELAEVRLCASKLWPDFYNEVLDRAADQLSALRLRILSTLRRQPSDAAAVGVVSKAVMGTAADAADVTGPLPTTRRTITLAQGAEAVKRDKGTLSRWAERHPEIVATRDPHGKVSTLYAEELLRVSSERARRLSAKAEIHADAKRSARRNGVTPRK